MSLGPPWQVGLGKYRKVSPRAFGLVGRRRIAVIRATGAIVGGGGLGGATISAGPLIEQLQRAGKDKRVAGVVLRIDSPGGDALASDLLWRAVRELGDRKPVVASMGDVAASGA